MIQGVIILILIYVFFIYIKQSDTEVAMVKSSLDGTEYLVQNKPDKEQAANALASIKSELTKFIQYLRQNKGKHKSIETLLSRVDLNKISEGNEDSNYTTYTLNKGETTMSDNTKRTSLDAATEITIAWIQAWKSGRPEHTDVTEFFRETLKAVKKR